jgi:hypothetical protein
MFHNLIVTTLVHLGIAKRSRYFPVASVLVNGRYSEYDSVPETADTRKWQKCCAQIS